MSNNAFATLCQNLGKNRLRSFSAESHSEPTPTVDYPFSWGECWTGNIGVAVSDFESEIGFWIDILGFRPFAFFEDTLMFRSIDNSFGMSLSQATEDQPPSHSITVELMLDNLEEATEIIRSRGAEFSKTLFPVWGEEQTMRTTELISPAGFRVILWGMIDNNRPGTEVALQTSDIVEAT
ncbi:MAG: VOC family protein [Candidatus Kapaibacterium sp.]